MPTIKTIEFEFTDEEIEDIIDAAGYGIGYWATELRIDSDERMVLITYLDPDESDPFVHPDAIENRTVNLSYENVLWAINELLARRIQVNDRIHGYMTSGDIGNFDSDVGDVIMQAALFGEIIYG